MSKKISTVAVARVVGIAPHTLHRWIREGKVKPPKPVLRNGRGVRLWTPADVKRLREVKERTYRKGRGRKPKKKA